MSTQIHKENLIQALRIALHVLERANRYIDFDGQEVFNGKSIFHAGIEKVLNDLEKGEQLQVVED